MKKLLFFIALTLFSATQVLGQQKIKDGTATGQNLPNKDALLELESLNKGLLHVRLELKELSDPSPLSAHTAGMMVYNTAETESVRPGLYYNDGTRWVLLETSGGHADIVTTLVDNKDGTYTYTSEDGTVTVIDVPADVIENFQTIIQDNGVRNEILNLIQEVGGNVYYDGDTFTYIDGNGDVQNISFEDIVKAYETITTLVDNTDGTYTYTSEDGTVTIIDVPASVVNNFEEIVSSGPININGNDYTTIEEYIRYLANSSVAVNGGDMITVTGNGTAADPYVVSIEGGDPNSMLITNAAGDLEWATIESIVQANETVTTLVDNGDGTYTYTNESGDKVTIDIPSSVVKNFENIVNDGPVTINGDTFNTVEEYLTHVANASVAVGGSEFITVSGDGTSANPYVVSIKEGADNTMLITDDNGNLVWATIEDIVTANETLTVLSYDVSTHTLSYKDENGVIETINLETGSISYDDAEHKIVYTPAAGSPVELDLNDTDLSYIADDNKLIYVNSRGQKQEIDLASLVSANETVTRIEEKDGIYTYYNEEDTPFIIDIPSSVVENFENIYNQIVNEEITVDGDTYNSFEEYLTQVINNATTFEDNEFIKVEGDGSTANPYKITIIEGDANSMLITNEDGDLEWATIESIVQANETETILRDNGDGTYTYFNEAAIDADGNVIEANGVVINVPSSVVENFENIYNQIVNEEITVDGDTYETFEEYLTTIVNNNTVFEDNDFITVTGDGSADNPYEITIKEGDANSMLITNAAGELEWATIESIVQTNETETILRDNGDGTYTYFNEAAIDADGNVIEANGVVINVPSSVVENFENIYNQIVNEEITVDGDTYETFEEYLTTIVNNNTNFEDNDFITVTGDGSADNPYEITIKEGDENSMLITNGDGDLEWATIDSLVNANIDAKDLTAAVDDSTDPENPSTNTTIEVVTGGEKAVLVETSIRVKEESITTDHIQNGTIKPEDIAQAGDNQILVTDEDGNPEWKDADKVTPRFFYMPAVIFDTKETATGLKRNLYEEYKKQFTGEAYEIAHGKDGYSVPFTGGLIGSTGAPAAIHVFESDELYYYVTYYDTEVFANLSINEDGELTYDIIGNATPSSYMNIVFVIK